MYSIDLTFLRSKELEDEIDKPEMVYTELLRKHVIKSICPNEMDKGYCGSG